jgi:hypothetical protein
VYKSINTPFGRAYGNGSYSGGILQREVQNRYLVKASLWEAADRVALLEASERGLEIAA